MLSISMNSLGQVHKLKATSFSSKGKNDYKWSEGKESSILITFNLDKDRITIYSKTTQIYDIAEYEGKTTDSDGDDIFSYYCVDADGNNCRVKWL